MCVCSHVNYPAFSFCTECGYAKSAITNKDHYRSVKQHTQIAVNNTAVDHHQENLDMLEREERLSKSSPSFFPPINNHSNSNSNYNSARSSNSQTPKSNRNEEIPSNSINYNYEDEEVEKIEKEKEEKQQVEEVENNNDNNNNKPVITHAFDNDYVEHKVVLVNNNNNNNNEQQQQEQNNENNEEGEGEIQQQQQQQEDYDQDSPKSVEDEQVENYVNDVLRQSINDIKVEDVFDMESGRRDKNKNNENEEAKEEDGNEEKQEEEENKDEEDKQEVNKQVDKKDPNDEDMKLKGFDEVESDSEYEKRSSVSSRRSSKFANFNDPLAFPQQFTNMVTGEKPQAVPICINLNLKPPSPPIRLSQFHLSKPNIEAKVEAKVEPPPATLIGGLVVKETKTI